MEKKPKGEVFYRKGHGDKYCRVCTMYVEPNACTAVQGHIASWALCDLFEKKKGDSEWLIQK